jgi:hypothetical protein
MKRIIMMLTVAALLVVALTITAAASFAAPLADNCTRTQGTVNCSTFEGPGNNQAGVGTTTDTKTQGNTSNFSPAPQEPGTSSSCNPSSSKGKPCNP